ncbi:class I alpha-mannosidase-like protein [Phyllosticta citriasiana]|uniref:alpha-1,2-Mannosidase n=1 Tax=Phyllosticta citriasiana TaxID=595635 RepID=A0ABR1KL74_9PEZI
MPPRRSTLLLVTAVFAILTLYHVSNISVREPPSPVPLRSYADRELQQPIRWGSVTEKFPVTSYRPLPTARPTTIPKIQYDRFADETPEHRIERERRLSIVKETFVHSWEGYKKYAWLQDELAPLSGQFKNTFGGWGATLVDSLDTLWIMGLHDEFEMAVKALKKIDFSTSDMGYLNVFETTIRYLGGLLSAYDLSGGKYPILLQKATEMGEMLYRAFDTPNRFPITRWDWRRKGVNGETQEAGTSAVVAEIGSLSMEFTRLSQLTGNPKYYDAIARITDEFEAQQDDTKVRGLWPISVNPRKKSLTYDRSFTFGAMADSLYEYLPKEYLLLGGVVEQYKRMFIDAIEAAKKHMFFRPLNPKNLDLLFSGTIRYVAGTKVTLEPEGQHLTCFAGGMVGIAAKIFNRPQDLQVARALTDGCIWAYESTPTGIMPEILQVVPCGQPGDDDCKWNQTRWYESVGERTGKKDQQVIKDYIESQHLPPGFTAYTDARYMLRPEAIESVFIMYRISGDQTLQDKGWNMFKSVVNYTTTDIGNAAINNVADPANPGQVDSCESFWTAETLKYYYLLFSEPDLVSLDEWVFNTEAHPFLRAR